MKIYEMKTDLSLLFLALIAHHLLLSYMEINRPPPPPSKIKVENSSQHNRKNKIKGEKNHH